MNPLLLEARDYLFDFRGLVVPLTDPPKYCGKSTHQLHTPTILPRSGHRLFHLGSVIPTRNQMPPTTFAMMFKLIQIRPQKRNPTIGSMTS